MSRSVAIAGAGYAGLTVAVALARRGWRVQVFERARSVRSEGYSIAFHENGLRTLEALDLLEPALARAAPMPDRVVLDRSGRLLMRFDEGGRVSRIPRPHLVGLLAEEAARLGAEVRLGASVESADPEGRLRLTDGGAVCADLVVAADGVASRLRDGLGLLARRVETGETALRALAPRRPGALGPRDDGATGFEFWSGRRRFLHRVVDETRAYVTFTCPALDSAARTSPPDPDVWSRAFPACADVVRRACLDADWSEARWASFRVVRLKRWSAGRVAVVGDAAHAMAPNLAQGGNCAMATALALAVFADGATDLARGLEDWERSERPVVEHAQLWSDRFTAAQRWPEPLWSRLLPGLARTRWAQRGMTFAARRAPVGWGTGPSEGGFPVDRPSPG